MDVAMTYLRFCKGQSFDLLGKCPVAPAIARRSCSRASWPQHALMTTPKAALLFAVLGLGDRPARRLRRPCLILGKSDGLSDKFDYVYLRNEAEKLPECLLVLTGTSPPRSCQFRSKRQSTSPSRIAA
jgi:hypothetical protein